MKLSEIIKSKDTVIHCMTENAAKELCAELHRLGRRWCGGSYYINNTNYTRYAENTCYRPLMGTCDSFKYFENQSFNIIPFSEVEFDEADQLETLIDCISDQTKQIDWEQRRYEIAKEVLSKLVVRGDLPRDFDYNVQRSIEYADELIKQLKG